MAGANFGADLTASDGLTSGVSLDTSPVSLLTSETELTGGCRGFLAAPAVFNVVVATIAAFSLSEGPTAFSLLMSGRDAGSGIRSNVPTLNLVLARSLLPYRSVFSASTAISPHSRPTLAATLDSVSSSNVLYHIPSSLLSPGGGTGVASSGGRGEGAGAGAETDFFALFRPVEDDAARRMQRSVPSLNLVWAARRFPYL
mmetsp:Transcript_17292/g.50247  ORF Transcript_17292/g.50247 Transcript_17292/m.50247 type:complete len:200 (+) Transcript_17292:1425-2024(+)